MHTDLTNDGRNKVQANAQTMGSHIAGKSPQRHILNHTRLPIIHLDPRARQTPTVAFSYYTRFSVHVGAGERDQRMAMPRLTMISTLTVADRIFRHELLEGQAKYFAVTDTECERAKPLMSYSNFSGTLPSVPDSRAAVHSVAVRLFD
jgi:hypothetical protein